MTRGPPCLERGQIGDPSPMPTKRAILAELTSHELRAVVDGHGLEVQDRRVKAQLVDAVARSRRARIGEILPDLSRDRLKELCRRFDLDDSGRKKADLVARLVRPARPAKERSGAAPAADSRTDLGVPEPSNDLLSVSQLERYLWSAADILRGSIDSGDYKSYIFGLLFLKRLSDRFEEEAEKLIGQGVAEDVAWTDPDEHQFFVPERARWKRIQSQATNIGETLNKACAALEEQNSSLEGVLAGIDYNDERKLGDAKNRDTVLARLVQHFSQVSLRNDRMAEPDLLGRAYEYLIEQFADDAGKKGGEFYTPRMVVRLMVELLAPSERMRICDPTAGSGGMLIECAHYIGRHGGNPGNLTPPWPGEEPRYLGDLQDEHAAPRVARRHDRKGRHDPGPEAGGRRRASPLRPRDRESPVQPRRMGPRRSRERRLRTVPVRRTAEDQGGFRVRPTHGGRPEQLRPTRRRDAARCAVPRRRRGENPPGLVARGSLRGGHRSPAEPLLRHRHPGVHPGAEPGQAERARRAQVLFIDASGEFEEGSNQNRLRSRGSSSASPVRVSRLRRRREVRAGRAMLAEIEQNDWNLNIRRYVDTSEEEVRIDVAESVRKLRQLERERVAAEADDESVSGGVRL